MEALWNMLEASGILVVGLAVRLLVPLLFLGLIAAVAVPSVYAAGGVQKLWLRLRAR